MARNVRSSLLADIPIFPTLFCSGSNCTHRCSTSSFLLGRGNSPWLFTSHLKYLNDLFSNDTRLSPANVANRSKKNPHTRSRITLLITMTRTNRSSQIPLKTLSLCFPSLSSDLSAYPAVLWASSPPRSTSSSFFFVIPPSSQEDWRSL